MPSTVTTVRFSPEEVALIRSLQKKLEPKMGSQSQADVVRMAIRALAAQEGIKR
jgi:hypothetical protein